MSNKNRCGNPGAGDHGGGGGEMSVKAQAVVWDSDLPRDEKYVLIGYVDHADHEGRRIYPSMDLVAWKTGYSVRQVQRITQKLLERGVLVDEGHSHLGTRLFSLNMSALPQRAPYGTVRKRGWPVKNGDIAMSPFSEKTVTFERENGDIAMSPEPSLEPSLKRVPSPKKQERARTPHQQYFESVCECIGWDYKTLSKEQRGQIAQAVGILQKANYTLEDLAQFRRYWWEKSYIGKEKGDYPTLNQLRAEIGKIRKRGETDEQKRTRTERQPDERARPPAWQIPGTPEYERFYDEFTGRKPVSEFADIIRLSPGGTGGTG